MDSEYVEEEFTLPDSLTPKQAKFVMEYLTDGNATQAAIRAGYSEKTAQRIGSENLSKPLIKQTIQEKQAHRAKRTLLDKDHIVSNLMTLVDRCMEKEPVRELVNGKYVDTGKWKFDSSGAARALDLLGRHLGIYIDKHHHSGEGITFINNYGFDEDKKREEEEKERLNAQTQQHL